MAFIERKTIPQAHRTSREVHNPSATPKVTLRELTRSRVFVPGLKHLNGDDGLVTSRSPSRWDWFGSKPPKGLFLVPLRRNPLTQDFRTSHGGTRFGGGGISKESLRRAKRKLKTR